MKEFAVPFPNIVFRYLVEFVLLAELHTLSPAVVALVKISSNTPELDQVVFLQSLRQANGIKVVVGVNGGSQSLQITTLTLPEGNVPKPDSCENLFLVSKRTSSTCSLYRLIMQTPPGCLIIMTIVNFCSSLQFAKSTKNRLFWLTLYGQ